MNVAKTVYKGADITRKSRCGFRVFVPMQENSLLFSCVSRVKETMHIPQSDAPKPGAVGPGLLDLDEFVEGCMQLHGPAKSLQARGGCWAAAQLMHELDV